MYKPGGADTALPFNNILTALNNLYDHKMCYRSNTSNLAEARTPPIDVRGKTSLIFKIRSSVKSTYFGYRVYNYETNTVIAGKETSTVLTEQTIDVTAYNKVFISFTVDGTKIGDIYAQDFKLI